MKTKYLASALCLLLAMSGGVYMSVRTWGQITYLSDIQLNSNSRIPAAIRRDLDFSKLDGAELITASQKRLVTAAQVILQEEDLGVQLGHFVTRGTTGKSQLACDFYDRVTMRFEAEGIADSGEKPVMEIEGPCRPATDITRIEPIWIPVARILGERPSDMDLAYGDGNVQFRFAHMGTEWPLRWSLQSVRLYNGEESGREVNISRQELREIMQKPLILNWRGMSASAK